jgi:hypothetical protein
MIQETAAPPKVSEPEELSDKGLDRRKFFFFSYKGPLQQNKPA